MSISTPADTHSALTDEAIGLGPVGGLRQAVRPGPGRGPPLGRGSPRPRGDAEPLPEPALGLRLPDRARAGRRRARWARCAGSSPGSRGTPRTTGPGRSGGGTLLDFGAHLVDQALTLLGPVESVYAESRTRESGLDDDVFVALRHTGGARLAPVGQLEPARAPGRASGSPAPPASLVVTTGDTQEDVLVTGASPATADTVGRRGGLRPGPALHRGGPRPVSLARGAWDTYYPAFARAVRGEGPPPGGRRPTPSRPPTCSRPPGSAPRPTRRSVPLRT